MALKVRNMPIGINTKLDSHMPVKGVSEFSFAIFSPVVLVK